MVGRAVRDQPVDRVGASSKSARVPPRSRRAALAAVAAVAGAVLLVGVPLVAGGRWDDLARGAPTPASLGALQSAGEAQRPLEIPPPGAGPDGVRVVRQVRLRHQVLVHTAPSSDSPRPAISLLGAGMVADLVADQGEWVQIKYGPLEGWTRKETVELLP